MTPVTKITKKSELIELFNSNLIVIQPVKSLLDEPNVIISSKDSFYFTRTKLIDITNLGLIFEINYPETYGNLKTTIKNRSIACKHIRIYSKTLDILHTIEIAELDLEG